MSEYERRITDHPFTERWYATLGRCGVSCGVCGAQEHDHADTTTRPRRYVADPPTEDKA